jgi:hypothetical protein
MEDPFFIADKDDYVKCLKALFSMYKNNLIHTFVQKPVTQSSSNEQLR